jgi:hypothetical protein
MVERQVTTIRVLPDRECTVPGHKFNDIYRSWHLGLSINKGRIYIYIKKYPRRQRKSLLRLLKSLLNQL